MKTQLTLILDNIRSIHNTASIFRTADGAGVSQIFLCGTTPAPVDRFGRIRKDFQKVSLGAEDSVDWKYFESTEDAILFAKEQKMEVVALEQSDISTPYDLYSPQEKVALILGTEVTGLTKNILDMCNTVVEIPMRGKKESLNVSIAAGIMMYKILK